MELVHRGVEHINGEGHPDIEGKSILGLDRAYCGMFRGKTKGDQREGFSDGEQEVWERDAKGNSQVSRGYLLGTFV